MLVDVGRARTISTPAATTPAIVRVDAIHVMIAAPPPGATVETLANAGAAHAAVKARTGPSRPSSASTKSRRRLRPRTASVGNRSERPARRATHVATTSEVTRAVAIA